MKAHELEVNPNKAPTRPGRGISAGRGKTAGRGTKGQNSRTGGGTRPGFEGGQVPLMRRLPHQRGFKSKQRYVFENVYTGELDQFKTGSKIDSTTLFEAGLVTSPHVRVKVILKGEVKNKYTVEAQAASQGAQDAISKAGGSYNKVERLKKLQLGPKDSK